MKDAEDGLSVHRWRRPVVKYGVSVSQVKPSNYFRRLGKLVLPSIFVTSLSYLMSETCRVIQQQFWMKEFDILGVKTYCDPLLHIWESRSPRTPNSRIQDLHLWRPRRLLLLPAPGTAARELMTSAADRIRDYQERTAAKVDTSIRSQTTF